MSKKRKNMGKAAFKRLVALVRLFDEAAANALYGVSKLETQEHHFVYHEDLECAFVWGATPQGHYYWSEVNHKVRKLRNFVKELGDTRWVKLS